MRNATFLAILAIALCAFRAQVASAKTTTASLTGTASSSNITSGVCSAVTDANGHTDSYDTICENPGSCECIDVSLNLSGGFGSGTAKLIATADVNPDVETGTEATACYPAFAAVTLSAKAKGKVPASTQTLNALGVICGTPITTPVTAQGGFTVEASSSGASGSGTFSGTLSQTGAVSIKLTGLITNP